jgi:hypothetical protein
MYVKTTAEGTVDTADDLVHEYSNGRCRLCFASVFTECVRVVVITFKACTENRVQLHAAQEASNKNSKHHATVLKRTQVVNGE